MPDSRYHRKEFPGGDLVAEGRAPVEVVPASVGSPRRARRRAVVAGGPRPPVRRVAHLLVVSMWTALAAGAVLVTTGHGDLIGLSAVSSRFPLAHLMLIVAALLVVGAAVGDLMLGGRRAETALARRPRTMTRGHRTGDRAGRGQLSVPPYIDGINLRDNPDLYDPNGFTGPGSEAPGAPQPE
jgi:hypothetical protein